MSSSALFVRPRRLLAALLAALLPLLALAAVWHPLHRHLHPDADDEGHECGITLLAAGQISADSPVPVRVPPIPVQWVFRVAEAGDLWVAGMFATRCVLEHAPPGLG